MKHRNHRKQLNGIQDEIIAFKAKAEAIIRDFSQKLEAMRDSVEEIQSFHQDYFDEKSERWKEGDNGSEHQDEIDGIQEVYGMIDSIASSFDIDQFNDNCDEVIAKIEEVKGE
jgi:hypothetical protein